MDKKGVTSWLILAILFLIVAIVAGILGFGLISESFFVVLAVIFAYFITRFVFLRYQEKILMERYGDEYCNYKEKVKTWI